MQYHYAIEIGGSFTTIYAKDGGFVLKEPTLVAVERNGEEYIASAFGKEAKSLLWKTNDSVEIFNPISNGVIENFHYTKVMLEHFFEKIKVRKFKKNIIVLIPCGLSVQNKNDYYKLFDEIGFENVDLVPSVVATAIGCGINISSPKANMVVNIGGATTDVAVMNLNSILQGVSLGIGGKKIDIAIANTLALPKNGENKRVLIGVPTAENLKNEIGSLYKNDTSKMEIVGLDFVNKSPKKRVVTVQDLRPVIVAFFEEILRTIDVTVNSLQPEISADILKSKIYFTGGLSKITGFADYLKINLPYPFEVIENGEDVTILGAGKLINDNSLLNKIINIC